MMTHLGKESKKKGLYYLHIYTFVYICELSLFAIPETIKHHKSTYSHSWVSSQIYWIDKHGIQSRYILTQDIDFSLDLCLFSYIGLKVSKKRKVLFSSDICLIAWSVSIFKIAKYSSSEGKCTENEHYYL